MDLILKFLVDLLGKIIKTILPRVFPWYEKHHDEWLKIARFFVVGTTSLLLYSGLYALLSRVIWRAGNHTLENFIATVLAALYNFYLNRNWTFRNDNDRSGTHLRHVRRFIIVAIAATLLQTFLFWLGHEFFKLYDFLVIYPVALLIAFFTYTAHRVYTFKPKNRELRIVN